MTVNQFHVNGQWALVAAVVNKETSVVVRMYCVWVTLINSQRTTAPSPPPDPSTQCEESLLIYQLYIIKIQGHSRWKLYSRGLSYCPVNKFWHADINEDSPHRREKQFRNSIWKSMTQVTKEYRQHSICFVLFFFNFFFKSSAVTRRNSMHFYKEKLSLCILFLFHWMWCLSV